MKQKIIKVVLNTPLDTRFDYWWKESDDTPIQPLVGQLVLLPFGRRIEVGLVVEVWDETIFPKEKLKTILAVRNQLQPLSQDWLALCLFAADYYQRSLGEVVLPALPKKLRESSTVSLNKALKKLTLLDAPENHFDPKLPLLNLPQKQAVKSIVDAEGFSPILLHGVTGSGKTEVYLHAAADIWARDPEAQILILVPEINLTPQLEEKIRARFLDKKIVSLHSELAEGARLTHWVAAHQGGANLVLGTRLAIFASLPRLKLIVVDEEHDLSYKQQEGLRYSARDLAVWRAQQLAIAVVLGSATPSLESWHRVQIKRYQMQILSDRAVKNAVLPKISLVDVKKNKSVEGLTLPLLAAIKQRLERGEQSLVFLNRRGYAPVIACDACGWVSQCHRCTAFMVMHKLGYRLRCHYCALEMSVPKACPTCGNVDLQPLGRGTQRVEEALQTHFPQARILRIDGDSTRRKGSAQKAFDSVHQGAVDILVGTQMVIKGHDFQNLTLVGVLNSDAVLFSQDYRASERLFAQLMQVAGRAGRSAQKIKGSVSEVLIQTQYPQHILYSAVMKHDYTGFAQQLLKEREQAQFPPYSHHALLRAEAKDLNLAMNFLREAVDCVGTHELISLNDPIPMAITRIANKARAQLLVTAFSRGALQFFLKGWRKQLHQIKPQAKWSLEVDPVDI